MNFSSSNIINYVPQEEMNSAVFEIINYPYYREERKNEDYYDDDDDELFTLRRSRKMSCSGCARIFCLYTPYIDHKVLCCKCSSLIRDGSIKVKISLDHKKDVLDNKKFLYQEIIELGLHPDRIQQTCPFETINFFE